MPLQEKLLEDPLVVLLPDRLDVDGRLLESVNVPVVNSDEKESVDPGNEELVSRGSDVPAPDESIDDPGPPTLEERLGGSEGNEVGPLELPLESGSDVPAELVGIESDGSSTLEDRPTLEDSIGDESVERFDVGPPEEPDEFILEEPAADELFQG